MTTRVGHWKSDRCDVYVGRGSIWGNPYVLPGAAARSRHRVIEVPDPVPAFERHLLASPDLLARLPELRGKVLGCYCLRLSARPPHPERCHAQVLARLADGGSVSVSESTRAPHDRSKVAPPNPVLDGPPTMTFAEWYARAR